MNYTALQVAYAAKLDNWWGIFIYSCLLNVKTIKLRKINCAEQEHMNMSSHEYVQLATPMQLFVLKKHNHSYVR